MFFRAVMINLSSNYVRSFILCLFICSFVCPLSWGFFRPYLSFRIRIKRLWYLFFNDTWFTEGFDRIHSRRGTKGQNMLFLVNKTSFDKNFCFNAALLEWMMTSTSVNPVSWDQKHLTCLEDSLLNSIFPKGRDGPFWNGNFFIFSIQ